MLPGCLGGALAIAEFGFGAACAFFPSPGRTRRDRRQTGRDQDGITPFQASAKARVMGREARSQPVFIDTLAFDVGRVAQSEGASNEKRCFVVFRVPVARIAIPALHLRRR